MAGLISSEIADGTSACSAVRRLSSSLRELGGREAGQDQVGQRAEAEDVELVPSRFRVAELRCEVGAGRESTMPGHRGRPGRWTRAGSCGDVPAALAGPRPASHRYAAADSARPSPRTRSAPRAPGGRGGGGARGPAPRPADAPSRPVSRPAGLAPCSAMNWSSRCQLRPCRKTTAGPPSCSSLYCSGWTMPSCEMPCNARYSRRAARRVDSRSASGAPSSDR